jgi:hypothetical protein
MSLEFVNVTYDSSHWGTAAIVGPAVVVASLGTGPLTVTGTANAAGDTLQVTIGAVTETYTVTGQDSGGAIILHRGLTNLVLSNTALSLSLNLNLPVNTLLEYLVPCFAQGTPILTRRGEVAVEHLREGDEALTLIGGGFAPISWIGRRSVELSRLRSRIAAWPLRVRAHAFAPGRPHTDLLLSPDHSVFVDGRLIPIRRLENGTSIVREPLDSVTYFHVELARHDILLAAGMPAESFLDTGNRADFDGVARSPAHAGKMESEARRIWSTQACAPLCEDGIEVEVARARLALRARSLGLVPDPRPRLRVGGHDISAERDGDTWRFALPQARVGATLVSDSFVPAVQFSGSPDQRCLGVPVARLVVDGHAIPLDTPLLGRGWHPPEHGLRWTEAVAALPPLSRLSIVLADIPREPRVESLPAAA